MFIYLRSTYLQDQWSILSEIGNVAVDVSRRRVHIPVDSQVRLDKILHWVGLYKPYNVTGYLLNERVQDCVILCPSAIFCWRFMKVMLRDSWDGFQAQKSWIKNGQKQFLSVPVEVVTMIFRLEKDGTEGTKIGDWMLCVFNGFWQYGSRETKHVTKPFKRFRVDYPIDIGGTKELGMLYTNGAQNP